MLNKRNTMKPWKKIKPPLNVQEHSSGNRIRWPAGRLYSRRLLSSRIMKILPGLTHAVTKESFLRRDWSCSFVKNGAACQVLNSAGKSVRRVVGNSRVKATVPSKIPRGRRRWILVRSRIQTKLMEYLAELRKCRNGKGRIFGAVKVIKVNIR